jgi:hypothetical protein
MQVASVANSPVTSDATQNNALVLSTSRTSYDNGYGDFCFGRVGDKDHLRAAKGQYENTRFQELDGFERFISAQTHMNEYGDHILTLKSIRTGVFPFFELPIEIRQRILRLIISPYLYNKHGGFSSYVLVEISNPFDIYTHSSGYPNQDTNDAGATFF